MKTVFLVTIENSFQASVLEGALNNEGIRSFTKNFVLSSVFSNISGFQIEVRVFEEDYEKALKILETGFPHLIKG